MSNKIKLQSNEPFDIEVEEEVARMSITINDMLTDMTEGVVENVSIPFAQIDTVTLKKVVEYCEHHVGSQPINYSLKNVPLSEFDSTFCPVVHEELFKLTMAANYLNIKPLLDLCCKTLAGHVQGKTSEQIRVMWNIKNDFTPEEEEMNEKENEWCEEI